MMHSFYLSTIAFYIGTVYIMADNDESRADFYLVVLVLGVIYPVLFDLNQFYQAGFTAYIKDYNNFFDVVGLGSTIVLLITLGTTSPYGF